MASIAKIRQLLETIRELAMFLTDDEISDIGKVLLRATNRILKSSKDGNSSGE